MKISNTIKVEKAIESIAKIEKLIKNLAKPKNLDKIKSIKNFLIIWFFNL